MATEKIIEVEVGTIWENKHGMRVVIGAGGYPLWLLTGLPLYSNIDFADWTLCEVVKPEPKVALNINASDLVAGTVVVGSWGGHEIRMDAERIQ